MTAEVEFLKGKVKSLNDEVERASDEDRGKGVQVDFRIFCSLTLQLHPGFDLKPLRHWSHQRWRAKPLMRWRKKPPFRKL